MIRGPGITGGTKSDTAALSIDLAPTILDMAGIPRPDHMDGKSLLPFITVRHLRPLWSGNPKRLQPSGDKRNNIGQNGLPRGVSRGGEQGKQ